MFATITTELAKYFVKFLLRESAHVSVRLFVVRWFVLIFVRRRQVLNVI